MGWTHWRELANEEDWYPDNVDYDGAACYELGINGKWKHYVIPVYVGETANLSKRMYKYGLNGSHLRKLLLKYWRYEYVLWFRYFPVYDKTDAMKMQNLLLNRFGLERYPWNTQFSNSTP